jgi:hypothetical protein
MPENNQMMSVQGQLVGMPLAGPESFSQQQLDYLKRALGVDETVLWEGTGWSVGDTGQSFTLSESPLNFKTIKVYGYRPLGTGNGIYSAVFSEEFDPNFLLTNSITRVMLSYSINNNGNRIVGGMGISGVTGTSWSEAGGFHMAGNTISNGEFAHVHKVVGIVRIAGGNNT